MPNRTTPPPDRAAERSNRASPSTARNRWSASDRFIAFLTHLLALLVVATIPGSAVRPLSVELEAPPLPSQAGSGDRSASLEVELVLRQNDGTDGPPVEDARVRALTWVGDRAYSAADVRAEHGRAVLEHLPPGEHWIVAEAPGLARASRMVVLVSGARSLKLSMAPGKSLDVTVVDEAGAPIADAEIETMGGDPFPLGARTDANGRATVTRLTKGPYTVSVSHAGFDKVEARHPTDETQLRVVMKKLGALRVSVVGPDGKKVAGARIDITSATMWPGRRAETPASGEIRIGGLQEGTYALRAVSGSLASPTELAVTLGHAEEKDITLRLAAGFSVTVRVLDGENDPPSALAGARVTLAESGLSAFPVEGVSAKDGTVTLGPIPRGGASLMVGHDDYVSATVAVPDSPAGPIEVVLPRAGTFKGRVVDARGFPVDGARVEIVGTDLRGLPIADDPRRTSFRTARFDRALEGPRPLVPAGELGVMPGPLPDTPHGNFLPKSASNDPNAGWITARDGTFVAKPVTPGRVRALVRHPQYVEASSDFVDLVPGGSIEVTIVMRTGGLLEGRVVDSRDRAVENAEVTAMATRGTFERVTRTDRDGAFAFASLPEEVTLVVERPVGQAGAPVRLEAKVPEGASVKVRVVLTDPRDDLPVRVLDARGSGIDGAQVTVGSLDPASPLRTTVFTDRRGEAKLAGARGLSLHAEIRAPKFAPRSVDLAATATELRAELVVSESVEGEIRSSRRDPLADAEITLYAEDGAHRTRTDKDGNYTFKDVPPGLARLRVRAAGFAPKLRDTQVQESGGRRPTTVPRIELDEEGAVVGLVVDGRGEPIPGARIAKDSVPVVVVTGTAPPGLAVADARGRFRLAELPQGLLTLEGYAAGRGRGRLSVRVTAGRTTKDVKLQLDGEREPTKEAQGSGGVAITLGESSSGGVREVGIASVVEGSAAERAGLEPGDILEEISGVAVHTIAEARARLTGPLADDVVVKLRRQGRLESRRVSREEVRR